MLLHDEQAIHLTRTFLNFINSSAQELSRWKQRKAQLYSSRAF